MRVLIIEDNLDIAANVGDYLELLGHSADYASDGVMGLNLAVANDYDAIVLDINLPRLQGFDVCRKLKEEHQVWTPILMLTARDSLADKVEGFEVGALDYLVKPFELKELEIRLRVLATRSDAQASNVLTVGDITLNLKQYHAERAGAEMKLHLASLKILEKLMRSAPNVVTRQDLEYLLWADHPPSSDPLRSHMYELRKEIDKGRTGKMLRTVRGVGFVLSELSESDEGIV
ncbi:response regulator transcription factor [Arenicella sp. 4NH20-0111]|uniref:response regulator transcription factor n=1 Tax=Arenicella sp. 4NH20-0111 TaxID=3127648 RepID=UPI0031039AA5